MMHLFFLLAGSLFTSYLTSQQLNYNDGNSATPLVTQATSMQRNTRKDIIYEQIASDYFADSLYYSLTPFKNSVIYFDGMVNQHLTVLFCSCISDKAGKGEIKDSRLNNHLKINPDTAYWNSNQKDTFLIQVHSKYNSTSKTQNKEEFNLIVRQNKKVGTKNYVSLVLAGEIDWEVYLIMDQSGKVKDWCYDRLRF